MDHRGAVLSTARRAWRAGAAVGAALLLVPVPAATSHAPQGAPTLNGVWEAVRVNREELPMTDEVVGDDGFTHAVRLHGMTIRLRPNGRFQALLQYRRAILTRGERVAAAPLQNDTWIGTYTLRDSAVRFVPEKQGNRQVAPFDGVVAGRRILVSFDYEIVTRKRYVLDMERNDNIW